jgi:hypothetical protein
MTGRDVAAARRRAEALVEAGLAGGAGSGEVGDPIRILSPAGNLHSWFVPFVAGDVLTGFLELAPDLEPRRASTFQRHPDSLAGCPPAASWLDADTVRQHAAAALSPGESALAPHLSYDRTPARLAWAVPVTSADGHERTLYVAGDTVWVGDRGTADDTVD